MPLIICTDCGATVEAARSDRRLCDACRLTRRRAGNRARLAARYVPAAPKDLTCTRCGTTYHSPNNRGRFCPPCREVHGKEYAAAWQRASKYGVTTADYLELVEKAGGRCGICHAPAADLVVDHCHASGKIRGVLCNRCNRAIGLLGDTYEGVHRAAVYLRDAWLSQDNACVPSADATAQPPSVAAGAPAPPEPRGIISAEELADYYAQHPEEVTPEALARSQAVQDVLAARHERRTSGPLDPEIHAALVRSVERGRGTFSAAGEAPS